MRPSFRISLSACLLVITCSVGTSVTGATTLTLDFGTADSPLRPGFTRVTPESMPGISWGTQGTLQAGARQIEREWTYNESQGRSNPPTSFLSDLTCDHLQSDVPATLTLDVPPGTYQVYALCGAAGGNRSQVWDVSLSVGAETVSATFAGPAEVRALTRQVQAGNNGLTLQLNTRSRWLLNALIVAPQAQWNEVSSTLIAPIERETFLLPEDVLESWEETPRQQRQPLPPAFADQAAAGALVYNRHYLEPIWPESIPTAKEINPTLRAFAARDEYEPLTFTILALKNLKQVNVTISDLTSAAGEVIPRRNIELRYVRYMMVRPNYRTYGTYYAAPDVLMPWRPQTLQERENLRCWATVYVDPGAKDGVYHGSATVTIEGEPCADIPILFRVVGITLQKDRDLVYGQYYHHPHRDMDNAPDAFSRTWWRRKADLEHADMAAHGNNTLVLGISGRQTNDRWQLDFDRLGRDIDLYYRHGFYQPIICHIPISSLYWKYMQKGMGSHLRLVQVPPAGFFREVTELVRIIESERQRRQWPELLYYPVDEPSRSQVSVDFMTRTMAAIKEVPGVRTYVTADPAHPEFTPMKPYVDVWCCQPFSLDRDTIVRDMQERSVAYWCYPNHIAGENDHTPCAGARMTYGFGFWRSGFQALTPWIYQAIVGDQWNYLDGTSMDFFNRTADDASPIPVTLWEAYREGIDDGRYITTLQRSIERAREAGYADLATQAQTDLDTVWNAIRVQEKYKEDGLWDGHAFDVYRWLIASQILRLQAVLQ